MRGTPIDDLDEGDLLAVSVGGDVFAGHYEGVHKWNRLYVLRLRLRLDSAPAPYRVLDLITDEIEVICRHQRARPLVDEDCL